METAEEGWRGDLEFETTPRLAVLAAERYGYAICIEDGEHQLSYWEVGAIARQVTRGLIALGIRPGDHVAIQAPNIWEWVPAALGVHGAGAVLVPVNTRYKGQETSYILGKTKARVFLTVTDFLGTDYVAQLRAVSPELPQLAHTIVLRGDAPADGLTLRALIARGDSVTVKEGEARADAVSPDDPCDVLFTSGTTGHPKGTVTTHGQTLRAFRDWSGVVGLRARDRYLVVAPFFHAFGYKAGWLSALMMGATILPQAVFDAGAVLARIGRDRVTMLPGPPALYQSILMNPALMRHDLSSLRLAVTGAATIPVQLIRDMRDVLGFETVITGYGLTEATGIATMCRHDDDPETVATTSGRAIPGVEVRVVHDSGEAVAPGEPGEVVVRGYNIMKGYLDDPEQTAVAVDADGWLHTGDIGVMDARGYLRITDRKKDMFIVGGFNAYPAEIEHALLTHPAIADAAVIGVPDPRLGEVGKAFIVVTPGAELPGADALIAWCRERMANFKVPRQVAVVETLPRNASGKVMKFVLREAT